MSQCTEGGPHRGPKLPRAVLALTMHLPDQDAAVPGLLGVLTWFAAVRLPAQLSLPGSHVVAPPPRGSVMHLGVYVTSPAGAAGYVLLLVSLPRT